jgi:hypothetical protein
MSDPLYHKDLLRLAADATGAGRLAFPDASGLAYNPACGDKVVVDLRHLRPFSGRASRPPTLHASSNCAPT